MKLLTHKFFDVLERKMSLSEFQAWICSLDNRDELLRDTKWRTFLEFDYQSERVGYEFSRLLRNFNLDEYAIYKFGSTLDAILADGNLFRILNSCHDFSVRYDYPLFMLFGEYNEELLMDAGAYDAVRQKVAALADNLIWQWLSQPSDAHRLAMLRGKQDVAPLEDSGDTAAYSRFYGRLWKVWKN